MRKINPFVLLTLMITILLAANILLLPRYISRTIDVRNMNTVIASNRDEFSFLETGNGSVQDTVYALDKIKPNGSNLKLIASFDSSAKINDKLLQNVYDQAVEAAEYGMLPGLGSRENNLVMKFGLENTVFENWRDYICSAKYYSLSYDSKEQENTQEILNFWLLRFSDGVAFDYYFLVDASTYRIYYAEIYNSYTEMYVDMFEIQYGTSELEKFHKNISSQKIFKLSVSDSISVNEDGFAKGCQSYYEAENCRFIRTGNLTDKLFLIVLGFEEGTLYVEQLALPADTLKYRGISVGFQGISEKIQNLLKE